MVWWRICLCLTDILNIMILTLNIFDQDEASLLIDSGGISINGDTNNSNSSTHNLTVSDNSTVDIIVSQSGYKDYSMTIDNVYSSDKTVSIFLGQELVISSPEYNRPTPRFTTFLDPFSFKVDFYKTSSTFGETYWYLNNELYLSNNTKGSFSTVGPTNFQLKIRESVSDTELLWEKFYATSEQGNTVKESVDDIQTYLDADVNTNTTTVEYRPSFTLDISSPNSFQLNGDLCYVRDEDVSITPSVTIKRLGSTTSDYTITYRVETPTGYKIVNDVEMSLAAFTPLEFSLTELGVYNVTVTLSDVDAGLTYVQTAQVESCNFVDIKYKSANLFELTNRSASRTIQVKVSSIEGDVSVPLTEVLPDGILQIPLNNIEPYIVTYFYDKVVENETIQVEEQVIITNYSSIEDCLSGHIESNLCGETSLGDPKSSSGCNECPDDIELNQTLLLMYTFFMKINKLYAFNNFYSGLEDSTIAEVTSIKNIGNKLVEFCKKNGCINSSTSAFGQSTNQSNWSSTNKPCNCS